MNNRLKPILPFLLLRVLCSVAVLLMLGITGLAKDKGPAPMEFKSPDGNFLVRLYPANNHTLGNSVYDRAELIEITSQKVLCEFGGRDSGEGFETDSVVWSPQSTHVALYNHDHRMGNAEVIQISKGSITKCTIPDYPLPDEDKPENKGRHLQRWCKPVRWLSENTLLLNDSETIEQQRGVQAYLNIEYAVQIAFNGEGVGTIEEVKQTKFARDKTWLK